MEQYKETLINFGVVNANGKVYDAADFEVESEVPVVIMKPTIHGQPVSEQVGRAKVSKVSNTSLTADINLQGEHFGFAKDRLAEGYKFCPEGTGFVDENNYIRQYKLLRIIITKESDKW